MTITDFILYFLAAIGLLTVILAFIGRTSIYKAYLTAKGTYVDEAKKKGEL